MTITVNPALLTQMEQIQWFEHVGKPLPDADVADIHQIFGWDEVPIYLYTSDWDDTLLEARNALTRHLHQHCRSEYQEWNEVVDEAKPLIETNIMPKVLHFQEEYRFKKTFSATIRWCLMAAIMEDAYRAYHPPVNFFTNLLDLYQAGHFPCGWVEGKWPAGKLVVF